MDDSVFSRKQWFFFVMRGQVCEFSCWYFDRVHILNRLATYLALMSFLRCAVCRMLDFDQLAFCDAVNGADTTPWKTHFADDPLRSDLDDVH